MEGIGKTKHCSGHIIFKKAHVNKRCLIKNLAVKNYIKSPEIILEFERKKKMIHNTVKENIEKTQKINLPGSNSAARTIEAPIAPRAEGS